MTFEAFPKIPRLNREIVITEKIDGTNAAVVITPQTPESHGDPDIVAVVDGMDIYAQSRSRLITPGFMNPEGIIVFHTAAGQMFKVTCKDDEKPKGQK